MKAGIAITVSLIGILCSLQVALADDLFYSGDVVTESIGISIDIDEEATVNTVYLLRNRGSVEEEIDLQFTDPPLSLQVDGETLGNPVVFNPGERRSVNATFKLDSTGGTTKTLYLDPVLLFDGIPNAEPAGTLMIEALLPEGVSGLAWASHEPDEESLDGGRKLYSWKDTTVYPTPLTLKWSILGIDLSVDKSASPLEITEPGQVINIQITLTNNGDAALNDIRLVDQYVISAFAEIEPSVESGTKENTLFWQKHISTLGPGENTTVSYSIKYIAAIPQIHEFDLKPTVITVEGHLISVSNTVRMKQSAELPVSASEPQTTPAELEETPEPEADGTENSAWPFIAGGIILALLIMGGAVYFIRRRRHAE